MPFNRDPNASPLAPGIKIVVPEANQIIQVPHLTIGQRREHRATIREIRELNPLAVGASKEAEYEHEDHAEDLLRKMVVVALSRNYPNVIEADLDNLTMPDLNRAARYALGGDEEAKGEPAAAPSALPPLNGKPVAAVMN